MSCSNTGSSQWICNNNSIGGITVSNSGSGACRIIVVRPSMPVSGASFTFSNNIIGGVNDHSIQITSNNASNLLHGVLDNGGHNVSTITGNVIRNLVNTGGTGTGLNSSVIGIAGNKIFAGY